MNLKKDPPGLTGTPTCTDHTNNTITIGWSKPRNDGGSPVIGYVVEMKEKGERSWTSLTTPQDRMNDNEYTAKGLQPGKEYEFRVAAANKAGVGKFTTTDAPVEARPPDCAPKAFGFINGFKEMTVKAGETLRIVVPFQGSPKPTTNWSKVGEDMLKEDTRTKFEITQNEAALVATNATLKDTGTYNCTLRNDFGSERVAIKVTVIDKPAQPQGPLEVSNIKADGCTLSWKPPKVNMIFFC